MLKRITPKHPLTSEIKDATGITPVGFVPSDIYMDLAIAARGDFFIGNCVSSYSGIITREREQSDGLATTFFGVSPAEKSVRGAKDEL